MNRVVIIGAGPAGLTAAYELLKGTRKFDVTIIEKQATVGGIAKRVGQNGNIMDIGGHRFISDIPEINEWWKRIMPLQGSLPFDDRALQRKSKIAKNGPDPEKSEVVMLSRNRLSRIFFKRKFFDYPVVFNTSAIKNMGLGTSLCVGMSYLKSKVWRRNEKNLEDYYVNQFGKKLYSMFFEKYTENLWGRHPRDISPEYGRQRVNDKISVVKMIGDLARSFFKKECHGDGYVDDFLYPKYGPGQFWEAVADEIQKMGGRIITEAEASRIKLASNGMVEGIIYNKGRKVNLKCDYLLSSMPIKDLAMIIDNVPKKYQKIAEGLPYRDYMIAGVLVDKLALKNTTGIKTLNNLIPDCWVYVHDRDVKMGRIQIFNNWSPYLVKDVKNRVWLGLEYFCNEGDELWKMKDGDFVKMAFGELAKIGVVDGASEILDYHVERVEKAYPAYFDTYERIGELRKYLDKFPNLYLIGRNGQHRYNNMDHSMMTAMEAVKNILNGVTTKENIWGVNAEKD